MTYLESIANHLGVGSNGNIFTFTFYLQKDEAHSKVHIISSIIWKWKWKWKWGKPVLKAFFHIYIIYTYKSISDLYTQGGSSTGTPLKTVPR
jgi:hypothetical protein